MCTIWSKPSSNCCTFANVTNFDLTWTEFTNEYLSNWKLQPRPQARESWTMWSNLQKNEIYKFFNFRKNPKWKSRKRKNEFNLLVNIYSISTICNNIIQELLFLHILHSRESLEGEMTIEDAMKVEYKETSITKQVLKGNMR